MKTRYFSISLLAFCLSLAQASAREPVCEPAELRPTLEELNDSDQGSRTGTAPTNDIGNQDSLRLIVETCGWPKAEVVGQKAAMGAFLVLQHAPLEMQLEYLPMLRAVEEKGHLVPGTLPYLEDRVRVRQNKPQIFGTQFAIYCQLYEIADPKNVNQLREAAGLDPLEDYVEFCLENTTEQ